MLSHWLYFYRNERQQSAVEWLGELDDLSTNLEAAGRHAAEKARAHAAGAGEAYERASTGRQPRSEADRAAAKRVLARLGPAPTAAAARDEEAQLVAEIGRMRHHAELTVMMTMGFRNAEALAADILSQADPSAKQAAQAGGAPGDALGGLLLAESKRLVRETLEALGHGQRRAELPSGTLEECLA